MAKQPKYYVVWHGRETGVFDSWEACKEQIEGYTGAIYKSFPTKLTADIAFGTDSSYYISHVGNKNILTPEQIKKYGLPVMESIAVAGTCNKITGKAEYQGVHVKTNEVLFRFGPLENSTQNIVEFLAIVHALALSKKWHWNVPVYSECTLAFGWIDDKFAKTSHPRNETNKKLFDLIARAEKWLENNTYENDILKWETKAWGENPADFGSN